MRRLRRGIAAMLAFALVLTASACSPAAPIGVRRDGDTFTVVVGRQCRPETYLTTLRVVNYDRKTHRRADTPLWEITADQARAVHSIVLGQPPDGYRETVNTLDTQRVGTTLAVDVQAGRPDNGLFDVRRMRDGKVLDAGAELLSEEEFLRSVDCG